MAQPRPGARVADRPRSVPEVVVAGSASRDIAPDDPRGWRLGGGVTYTALTCARLGLRTAAVIGLDSLAFEAGELDLLTAAGVDLLRVPLPHGPVYLNVESPGGRIQTCLDAGSPLPHVAIPAAWRRAPAWILAAVAGELDEEWTAPIPADAFVVLGWQGFLRTLTAGERVTRRPPAPGRLVERADLVGLSVHDTDPGTSLEDLARLLHPGAWLVYTNGIEGGRLAVVAAGGVGRVESYAAITAAREVDATGAGDTFLAALAVSVIRGGLDLALRDRTDGAADGAAPAWPDLRFAAAAASFAVEGPGLATIPDRAAVFRRIALDAGQSPDAGQSSAETPSSAT